MSSAISRSRDGEQSPDCTGVGHQRAWPWSLTTSLWYPAYFKNLLGSHHIIKPNVTWDSSENPIDYDWSETPKPPKPPVDYSVDTQLGIPTNIQLYWYEWMVYELEDCVDDFFARHPETYGKQDCSIRGTQGPLRNLGVIVNISRSGHSPIGAVHESCYGFTSDAEDALDFRHLAEHRDAPMDMRHLVAAIDLPRVLGDHARAEKFARVYRVLKAGLPEPGDDTEETKDIRAMIFSRHVFADPELDLLSTLIDDLKKCSFDWAKRLHPEEFPADAIYKAYEPKFWDRRWRYRWWDQDEASKIAFSDRRWSLLEYTFKGVTEIRNHFTHRNGPLDQTRHPRGNFWFFMGDAVKLPILLGDLDLAFRIDKLIRQFTNPQLSHDEIEAEFRADQIQSTVEKLLDPSTRPSVIAEWYPNDGDHDNDIVDDQHAAAMLVLRERWVIIDVLMDGEQKQREPIPPSPDSEDVPLVPVLPEEDPFAPLPDPRWPTPPPSEHEDESENSYTIEEYLRFFRETNDDNNVDEDGNDSNVLPSRLRRWTTGFELFFKGLRG